MAKEAHPEMPPLGPESCPWIENWDHFCDRPKHHRGKHHCPCGLESR